MPGSFPTRILTPLGEVARTSAVYVRAEAADGLLGVMAGHAPMLVRLVVGAVRITQADGDQRWFATSGGVLRVTAEGEVLLLVEAAEEAPAIDVERAQQALTRAQHRLRERGAGVDVVRAELALARALNRLRVAEYARQ